MTTVHPMAASYSGDSGFTMTLARISSFVLLFFFGKIVAAKISSARENRFSLAVVAPVCENTDFYIPVEPLPQKGSFSCVRISFM